MEPNQNPPQDQSQSQDDSQTAQATDELSILKQELQQMTEMAKRAMADLQNLKRRQEEERSQMIFMASASLIKALLPIVDNLNRAKQHIPQGTNKDWSEGIFICINQLNQLLKDSGVQEIEAIGKPFNPDFHEALLQGPGEKNLITEELEKGYLLGTQVLRHAKVKVGDGSASEASAKNLK